MTTTRTVRALLASGLLTAAACSFLDVTNPGPLGDDALNDPGAVPGIVTGMSFDLSRSMDNVTQESAIMADELFHGGSYAAEGLFNRGIIREDDVNGLWGAMHRARWVAESGVERVKVVLGTGFDASALAARAYIYAGLANRILGEHVCDAVIDGSAKQPFAVHFSRAEGHFNEAIRIAGNITTAALRDSLRRAAWGGRASVRAWQNNWAGADADAALVPTNYVFVAFFSTNTGAENNDLVFETNNRLEYTVFNTQWATTFGEPRVKWDTVKTTSGAVQKGQDGRTNFFRQRKYDGLGADIPLIKGTEMLALRAEAALRNNDVPGAVTFMNQARAATTPPLAALNPAPTTPAQAWPVLQKERGAITWLEARRFWDLRRWGAEAAPVHTTWFESPATRDKCIPVSRNELLSNPNL